MPGLAVFTRMRRAAGGIGRFVAPRERMLRVSGLVTLSVIAVALTAYGGGVLLTLVAGPRTGAAAAKPVTASEKAVRQGPALVSPLVVAPANAPSGEPAVRAGLYMARAKAGDAAAQYHVGVLYARGDGLVQDYASAFSWFHAAAAQGNVAAQYNLGVLYAEGHGVPADPGEALNWYRSAADQNHPGAQFNLALAYAEGAGTTQDYAAAARWYERAARQGLGSAMINLAILYEQGNGVERSLADAYAWYNAAADRGDAGGKQRTGTLFQQFSDRDKGRAQSLAATIAASLDATAPKSNSDQIKG